MCRGVPWYGSCLVCESTPRADLVRAWCASIATWLEPEICLITWCSTIHHVFVFFSTLVVMPAV
ncbi:unnamed protein product [Musa banksii]